MNRHLNLKSITQNEFNSLFYTPQFSTTPFSERLETLGFSTTLENIQIEANWHQPYTLDFSHCNFNNVNFKGYYNDIQFNNAQLENCKFIDAEIHQATFENAHLSNVAIIESHVADMSISKCTIDNGLFLSDVMERFSISDSTVKSTLFVDDSFGTLEGKNNLANDYAFIKTDIEGFTNISLIKTDVLNEESACLQESQFHLDVTIGVIGFSDWYSPAVEAISQFGADTLSISPYPLTSMLSFDYPAEQMNNLHLEVTLAIAHYDSETTGLSIPQYVLQSNQPTINHLKEIAKAHVESIDGLWIPGNGYDIQPEFYGQPHWFETHCAYDYQREMFEFALIDEMLQSGKPIMGVCHGSQIINVYFGGDLVQDVPNQWDDQWLQIQKTTGPIGDAIKNGILGESMHHQAIDNVAEGLEVVAKHGNVIKACQASDGSPIMLTQFHPEYLGDQANKNIVKNFVQAADKYHTLDTAIKLSDVLKMDDSLLQTLEVKFNQDKFELFDHGAQVEKNQYGDIEAPFNDLMPNSPWFPDAIMSENALANDQVLNEFMI